MTQPEVPPPPTKEELDAMLAPLSASERAMALEEFDRVLAERCEETDLASYGCLGSIIGLALLIAIPNLVRFVSLPRTARQVLMAVGILLVVGGLAMRALVPGTRVRDAGQRAQKAIVTIASLDYAADPAQWFREASTALIDAFYSGGPWTVGTFEFPEARQQLGAALPRMIAFETLIRLERSLYPVFTTFASPPGESGRTAR